MMIEDDELRNIFKTASEEHLQHLEAGLLHLEQQPEDRSGLEDLLREAHSLKGDANMLGVKDVGTLAHRIEDILGGIKRAEITLTPDLSDRLYQGLDAIRQLVHTAVTGEPREVNTFYILARLMGSNPDSPNPNPPPPNSNSLSGMPDRAIPPTPNPQLPTFETTELPSEAIPAPPVESPADLTVTTEPLPPAEVDFVSEPTLLTQNGHSDNPSSGHSLAAIPESPSPHPQEIATESPTPQAPDRRYRIETIRVETPKLDSLMTQAGELTVTKIRIAHRLTEIEEVSNLWEEWSRDTFVNRFAFQRLDRQDSKRPTLSDSTWRQIQTFHHRTEERLERLGTLINRLRGSVYEDTTRLDIVSNELEDGIRTLRLLPLATIFGLFPRMVRDLAKEQGKLINFVIEGGDTRADKRILEEMKDPLMHMIRNAIDHGIEIPEVRDRAGKPRTATLRVRGYQTSNNIIIEVSDDGRGLDIESIKQTALKRGLCRAEELATMSLSQIQSLIFAPGFSTRNFVTEVSGRGVGLDVVRTNVEHLKGSIQIESTPGQGCTLRIQLGTTLATAHVLIVSLANTVYAIPVEAVQTTLLIQPSEIFTLEGCETIVLSGQPVSIVRLANLLEHSSLREPTANTPNDPTLRNTSRLLPCIILKVNEERLGLIVDALLDEQDVVLKPQSKLLRRIRNISGATILGTGEVCMVLNSTDLLKSARRQTASPALQPILETAIAKQSILLVEDSITIRTQEKRILEGAGYEVVTAVDGLDGFNKLKTRHFDAVVSDIQMPNLDGLSLTAKIRQYKEYSDLPIILVTSLASDEDKRRGAEAGANAYITKGTFDQKVLLDTLRRLV